LKFYDSLDKKKKNLNLNNNKITIYVCGVTTSDYSHLGHAFSSMVFEVLQKYLEYKKIEVTRIQNFTDVDDKIIDKAKKEKLTMHQVSEKYINAFIQDMDKLRIKRADFYPRATDEISNIIDFIKKLEIKGFTYNLDGSVYFKVNNKEDYGKLSRRDLNNIVQGTRVEIEEKKQHPGDFALWKKSKEDEPFWDSPWGRGRPGWHIECSSMVMSNFGNSVDIHGGGLDLLFPHHENEIAQSEAISGVRFAKFWMHNGLLKISGDKMSKSTGNLIRLRDALKIHSPNSLRLWMLSSHYRNPIIYDRENILAQSKALRRLREATLISNMGKSHSDFSINKYREIFEKYMEDDLNTPKALSVLFDLSREINKLSTLGNDILGPQRLLKELAMILGLNLNEDQERENEDIDEAYIDDLINKRNKFRKNKLFKEADETREHLKKMGIEIRDSQEGTVWKKIN
tara:strand:+ start:135 stop:1502 length:1368 start_codon:yes stop_codon:yes gene_type:complete